MSNKRQRKSYTVEKDDTLSAISLELFKDATLWRTRLQKENGDTFTEEEANKIRAKQQIYYYEDSNSNSKNESSEQNFEDNNQKSASGQQSNITHKELLTFSNLTNLKWEFVDFEDNSQEGDVASENGQSEKNKTDSFKRLSDLLSDPKVFVKTNEKGEKISYVYGDNDKDGIINEEQAKFQMRQKAGIAMEYLEKSGEGNTEGNFLQDWEVIYAADNYRLTADYIDDMIKGRIKDLEKKKAELEKLTEKDIEEEFNKALAIFLLKEDDDNYKWEAPEDVDLKAEIEEELNNSEGWELRDKEVKDVEKILEDIEIESILMEYREENKEDEEVKHNFYDQIYGEGAAEEKLQELKAEIPEIEEKITELTILLDHPIYKSRDQLKENYEHMLFVKNTWSLANYSMQVLVSANILAKNSVNNEQIDKSKAELTRLKNTPQKTISEFTYKPWKGKTRVTKKRYPKEIRFKIKETEKTLQKSLDEKARKAIDDLFIQRSSEKIVADVTNDTGNKLLQMLSDLTTRFSTLDLIRARLDRHFQGVIKELENSLEIDAQELRRIDTEIVTTEPLKLYDTGFRY